MDWQDKIEVKKGNLGEQVVRNWLHKNDLIVYEPISDAAHGFDKLVSFGKEKLVIVEVKTKPSRIYYPDTGIDEKIYNSYIRISKRYNLPIYIFFVDEHKGQIYYTDLIEVSKEKKVLYNNKEIKYPLLSKGIIYFYQPDMKVIYNLTEKEKKEIMKYSNRNYKY